MYGSDAVAGVVNFIMRKDFDGMQASIDYGISSRRDGQRRGGSFTFGQTGEKGNVIAGVNYNKFDSISSGDRDFAKDATYLYGGVVGQRFAGSSRNPRGRIYLDPTQAAAFAAAASPESPAPPAPCFSDYRCYSGATDSYNYQAVNLVQTPQERTNAFFLGNYQIADDVNAFIEYYHNKTSANFAIAALPFDARGDVVLISATTTTTSSAPISGRNDRSASTPNLLDLGWPAPFAVCHHHRPVGHGRGTIPRRYLEVGIALNYGHIQFNQSYGYMDYAGLADARGPSFMDTDGVVKCGTPAT